MLRLLSDKSHTQGEKSRLGGGSFLWDVIFIQFFYVS